MFLLLVGSSLDWIPAARTTHVAWRGSVGCFAGVTCVPHVLRLWIAFHMPESVLYWFCFSLVCVLFFLQVGDIASFGHSPFVLLLQVRVVSDASARILGLWQGLW